MKSHILRDIGLPLGLAVAILGQLAPRVRPLQRIFGPSAYYALFMLAALMVILDLALT